MRSARRIVDLYEGVLRELGRAPADERVLDLGAGNGLGAEPLRRIAVGRVFGVDVEPQARAAADRDPSGRV